MNFFNYIATFAASLQAIYSKSIISISLETCIHKTLNIQFLFTITDQECIVSPPKILYNILDLNPMTIFQE